MSDDMWRRTGDDDNDRDENDRDDDDFGELRFSDDEPSRAPLSFDDDSPTLPHWTEPPTGELPRLFPESSSGSVPRQRPEAPRPGATSMGRDESSHDSGPRDSGSRDEDDVDVWGSYSGAAPRPVPDRPAPPPPDSSGGRPRVRLGEPSGGIRRDPSGGVGRAPAASAVGGFGDPSGSQPVPRRTGDTTETRRVSRSPMAEDPSGRVTTGGRPRPVTERGPRPRSERPSPGQSPRTAQRSSQRSSSRPSSRTGTGGRDMPTAVTVGLLIAAAFIGAILWKPVAVLAIVVLVCGLAAVEYFDKVTERGYSPSLIIGIAAAIAAPLAAYWVGEGALPLVITFALMAAGATFVGASGVQASPMPNMAITMLGIVWIGIMGSFAALLAGVSNVPGLGNAGTDTLFIMAVGVVANDVGALFVGSAAGKTPLREWISPNKTLEGLLGGALATFVGVWVVSLQSDTWNDIGEVLLLVIAIAVFAPLGDLVESMFKRNLEIKDFGTLVRGHGGVLDRFDGFLFVLPVTYYLLKVLEPFAS